MIGNTTVAGFYATINEALEEYGCRLTLLLVRVKHYDVIYAGRQ
jgi:hypothetical protein